jgi:basic membrane protein A and related proteins
VRVPPFAGAALAAVCVLLVPGCAGGESGGGSARTTVSAPAGVDGARLRVGLVTDIGGLNDRSFNQGNYEGLLRAERELGVEGRVLQSKRAADYVPNLSTLARQDYDLVVAVGFLMADATDVVAQRFPDTLFAIVDVPQASLKHRPTNVRGLVFKEQEGGYLAGYLAGLMVEEQGGRQVVSTVGGIKIPPVDRYIAGFQAGAKAANPGVTTLNGYSQDFVDQARCKEIALEQIDRGSQVVMQVAGGCGLGALDAARERNVWGIGADADQSFLGPHILSSALKLNPVSIFQTIESVRERSFRGGEDTVFDVKSGAVGLGQISPRVPNEIVARVNQIQEDLAAGRITDIPTTLAAG